MQVEIVSHCYATKLPQYAKFLAVQLDSLLRCPDYVTETVCCTESDRAVMDVLLKYRPLLGGRLRTMPMSVGEVGRRTIGRNRAALQTAADLVWFADVDYFWGAVCFETLAASWNGWWSAKDRPTLLWPKQAMTQADEYVGDALLETLGDGNPIDTSAFVPQRLRKAIGGVQIIAGWYCRNYGYLNHAKRRLAPVAPGRTMFRTTEDSAIRKHISAVGGEAMAIDLPGVYRLRHTRNAYQYPEGRPLPK